MYWNWEPAGGAGTKSGAYLHLRDLETGQEMPVPFERRGHRPMYSPDGKSILYGGSTDDGASHQLHVVSADGSRPASAIGPAFPGDDDHYFGFSPDGTQVFLVQAGITTLIDVASGTTIDLTGDAPEAGGWQRLAP